MKITRKGFLWGLSATTACGLFDYVYDRETGIGMKELEDF